ncbi:MAG: sulfotransferase domain-containing protein [Pseudomonadota bacterium]
MSGQTSGFDRDYLIITGSGRSGTNMLLDLMDCHDNTFCRNEPHALDTNPVFPMSEELAEDLVPDITMADWHHAMRFCATHSGERDRFDQEGKRYFRAGPLPALGLNIFKRRRARSALSFINPAYSTLEWPCPSLYINPRRLAESYPVFKILRSPVPITATHDQDPHQRVAHMIRDPKGNLRSWYNRYIIRTAGSPQKVFADNMTQVPSILRHYGEDPDRYGAFSEDALFETQLWLWRYIQETLIDRIGHSERYMPFLYADSVKKPVQTAEKLYGFLGLEFTEAHAEKVRSARNTLFAKGHSHDVPEARMDAAINTVLAGSKAMTFLDGLQNRAAA